MAAQTAQLLRPEDLADEARTSGLAATDREALLAVSRWIDDYVVQPHADLGRSGTVCPFVPGSLQRRSLHFAPERVAGLDAQQVVDLFRDYQRLFLATPPTDGDDAPYKTILVVLTDVAPERAADLFAEVLAQLAVPVYEEHGVVFGPYFAGNDAPAIHNREFHPFRSPAPFAFVRYTVLGDWEFFLDDPEQLGRWAHRFGPAAVEALAERLRGLPWRGAGH